MSILSVSELTIQRGGFVIVNKVSWRVERGEHWVILGANGSGKTSLLSALTGYLTPTSGRVELLSHTYGATDWRELRKSVGLVSSSVRQMIGEEEPALQTVISGKYAMIGFWGKIKAADHRRGLNVLRQIECESLADRPWLFLSQGERQRVLIGRALMANPPLLILDEPCAGLDPATREHFLQFLQRLGKRADGPTLVLVTHHVEEIMPAFSHALILQGGRSLARGRRSEVLTSSNLSKAFGAAMRLQRRNGRYSMRLTGKFGIGNAPDGFVTWGGKAGAVSDSD